MGSNSLFSQPFFFPTARLSGAFNSSFSSTSGLNVDGGPSVGNGLVGSNGDFTDPDDIQGSADKFTRSFGGNRDVFGKNPSPLTIMDTTFNFGNSIRPNGFIDDPNRSNPLLWKNPSARDILFGARAAGGLIVDGVNPFTGLPSLQLPFYPSTLSPLLMGSMGGGYGGLGSMGGLGGLFAGGFGFGGLFGGYGNMNTGGYLPSATPAVNNTNVNIFNFTDSPINLLFGSMGGFNQYF